MGAFDHPSVTIGLDVGGTKIAGGLVIFPMGRVLRRHVIPTLPQRGGEAVLADALALAERLMAEAEADGLGVRSIGVGVAELVDLRGNVTSSQTIAWRDMPIQASFSRLAPAVVESDVRAAALAEAKWGAGRAFRNFAYVTVGTGISYSLVLDGQPYTGARGNALVLASGALTYPCPRCHAMSHIVPEELASGPGLAAHYARKHPGQAMSGEGVMAAAAAGDPAAVEIVRMAGHVLGNCVGWLVNVLDPEAIVVGGGLGLAGGLYWDSFVAAARQHIWADSSRDLPILPAKLGVEAGLVGAAATAWRLKAETLG
ncbi:MAG: ROK family protein [Anaerolineae bacterium]|nr:ROK family protein [Anaerolineae bacterium]MDW8100559.1 ROK family protein [Anaerolineae bacterium]